MPEEVLVSAETGDDAAVYRLPDGQALVATVDFFTPIVDDPYDWGRIAAANAFSDVYAMGASPALALNISSWPVDDLSLDLLVEVLRGGQDIARAAGAVVLGGHTITDPEPKYGMVALGFTDPERLVRNSTVPPGARLVLTKPLGTGIVSTAIKRGEASPEQVRSAVELMTALNAGASEAMVEVGVAAATDVTGFGLLGHLQRMLEVSGVAAAVRADGVPLLPGVLDLARRGVVPSGTKRNHAFLRPHVDWAGLTEPEQLTLADAQTSGGLLIAVDPEMAEALQRALADRGVAGFDIGETEAGPAGRIRVTGRSSD
ncbi:MAG: selenide, water dikinase SelD [Actinobacteria bacterium RBG_19FT_COMBO_70_19]|nr:MAG: selenide, water dikinase SelD [Actinobacteria bacterium RBG_19FT_COMBO_70_19]